MIGLVNIISGPMKFEEVVNIIVLDRASSRAGLKYFHIRIKALSLSKIIYEKLKSALKMLADFDNTCLCVFVDDLLERET